MPPPLTSNTAVDVSKFHDSAVPEHFVALIRILIDEEAQHGSAFEGPCMEFFLKERMFETLCTLGVKDVRLCDNICRLFVVVAACRPQFGLLTFERRRRRACAS